MISRRHFVRLAASSALASGVIACPAFAQAWPTRFVRLIVPFPPGGGTDSVARLVGNRLSEIWGQQVVVENKGGAGANIGIEATARSAPDGHTILIASIGLAVNQFLFPSLGYDPINDIAPVTLLCQYPNLMTVPMSSPAKSVREFIAYAKANPGKITFASAGTGTSLHLAGELFKRMAGIEMTHIPYRGAGPALNDLIPGRVSCMFNVITSALPLVRTGQLRGLGVSTLARALVAPDIPTIDEAGVPGFNTSAWFAFFVPAKTPPEIIGKINADTKTALADPDIRDKMEQQLGQTIATSSPEELGDLVKSEVAKWGPIIKSAGFGIER